MGRNSSVNLSDERNRWNKSGLEGKGEAGAHDKSGRQHHSSQVACEGGLLVREKGPIGPAISPPRVGSCEKTSIRYGRVRLKGGGACGSCEK